RLLPAIASSAFAHQIDEDLLDLNSINECPLGFRIEPKARPNTCLFSPNQRQGARFFDHRDDILDAPFRLTATDEGSQTPDATPGAQYFRRRLVHHLRDRFDLVAF